MLLFFFYFYFSIIILLSVKLGFIFHLILNECFLLYFTVMHYNDSISLFDFLFSNCVVMVDVNIKRSHVTLIHIFSCKSQKEKHYWSLQHYVMSVKDSLLYKVLSKLYKNFFSVKYKK